LADGISQNQGMLMTTAFDTMKYLATSLITMLPDIIQVGIDLIFSLIDGITEMISDPVFVQSIIDVILKIVDILTNPDTITRLLNAAVTIIVALAKGLIQALPQLLAKVPEIISNLVKAFGQFLQPVIDIGKNIVDGIKKGISNAWNNLVSWFKGLFGDLISIAKKILGIASPSKVFKKIGGFTAEGFGAGFEDEFARVKDDMEDAMNFDDASVGINASIRKVGVGATGGAFGGTSIGNINIRIDGAKYTDEQSLAEAVAEAIQGMTDRRSAVYA
jgi:phage-related protein